MSVYVGLDFYGKLEGVQQTDLGGSYLGVRRKCWESAQL